jgi:hypothetical protein
MRLSDAGMRQRKSKAVYPNHRPTPWLTEDADPRSLEPIVRFQIALPSKQLLQLFARELEVTQDACQEPRTKCFASVNRNHRGATVAVTNEVMTALDSYHDESYAAQRRNKILALNSREGGHAPTVTRCTPMKSSASVGLPCTSRQSSIASRIRDISSSSDLACVWQPGNAGTVATK